MSRATGGTTRGTTRKLPAGRPSDGSSTSLPEATPAEEMYLKTLDRLEREGSPSVGALARELGVSAPSSSGMIHRLVDRGWTENDSREVHLTPLGRQLARRTIRRHRLAERLFTDLLGMPWEDVHEPACALEHVLTDEVTERLDDLLGHPATCPHGQPVPAADGTLTPSPGVPLGALSVGDAARVVSVSREDSELLSYLGTLGLVPGASVVIETVAPFEGPLLVRVGRSRYAIARDIAGLISVDPSTAG